jgi:5'-methylthioadenosine nucleosidase
MLRWPVSALFGLVILFATLSVAMSEQDLESQTINNVVIVIAMEAEAMPFINFLGLKPDLDFFPPSTPFDAFVGSYGECKVTVVTNGKDEIHETGVDNVGTVPAAMVTFLALQKLPETSLVINAGTCGGFQRKGAEIGDVFLTTAVAHHDRRIPIPEFQDYGVGRLETQMAHKLAEAHNFKQGVCTTGNSLDKTEEDDKHMEKNDASVKDMEAAAVAWSTHMFQKPYLGVKVVTDIVDGDRPTQDEFLENLATAAQKLQEALPQVIEHVCGRKHDEL